MVNLQLVTEVPTDAELKQLAAWPLGRDAFFTRFAFARTK